MPLRCLDPTGRNLQSFDFTEDEWRTLEHENRRARHLRLPCCSAEVILRRSRLGTAHFAHKSRGHCTTAPEGAEHLLLKEIAVVAARAHGWTAQTEVSGTSPTGEGWRADVLAQKGPHRVAIEIQWSPQPKEELLRRQQRYKEAGIRGLWLLRQPYFPVSHELPAAQVMGSLDEPFSAVVNKDQTVPLRAFLDAAFTRRLRFETAADAILSVKAGHQFCWSCGAQTCILVSLDVLYDGEEIPFGVEDFDGFPDLMGSIVSQLPTHLGIGEIKPRFSKTQGRSYMSNGCAHCDRLQGQFLRADALAAQEEVARLPIRLAGQWHRAVDWQHREYTGEAFELKTRWCIADHNPAASQVQGDSSPTLARPEVDFWPPVA